MKIKMKILTEILTPPSLIISSIDEFSVFLLFFGRLNAYFDVFGQMLRFQHVPNDF